MPTTTAQPATTRNAAFHDMETPLSRAVWTLTALDLALERCELSDDVDVQNAIGYLAGDALQFVKEGYDLWKEAFDSDKKARAKQARCQKAPASTEPPPITVTDAGRMRLLLQAIFDRIHVDGSTASLELTPEMADDLAAFGAEIEDLEPADKSEGEPVVAA